MRPGNLPRVNQVRVVALHALTHSPSLPPPLGSWVTGRVLARQVHSEWENLLPPPDRSLASGGGRF